MNNIPESHLFTDKDLRLFELNQIFMADTIWYEKGVGQESATFDLFVRELPTKRNYLLAGGLEEITTGIMNWKYTRDEADYLLENHLITSGFADYLQSFRFSGDMWAMPEGTAFFPNEPIIRITAPIIEANLLTMFLIDALVSNTLFLSKFSRIVSAAGQKAVLGSGIRAHSFESAMKATRAQYLTGVPVIAAPAFFRKYNLSFSPKLPGCIAYHAFVSSFDSETEAMQAAVDIFPDQVMLMVDTYDTKVGIENAIRIGREMLNKGKCLRSITIDSGDLLALSQLVRYRLDEEGMTETTITAGSNIDEYKITELEKQHAPIDGYIAVTEAVTSADAPKLEAVYKLVEIGEDEKARPTIKLSPGKISLPGKKQVFRKEGTYFTEDIIGLDTENLGKPLLVPVILRGKQVYELPNLDVIRTYIANQKAKLPPELLSVDIAEKYQVSISRKIGELIDQLKIDNAVRSDEVKPI